VAVKYHTTNGYEEVASKFEEIRKEHRIILIGGMDFKELGKILYSEDIKKQIIRECFVTYQ